MVAGFSILTVLAVASYGLNWLAHADSGELPVATAGPATAGPTARPATEPPSVPLAASPMVNDEPPELPPVPVLSLPDDPPLDGPGTFRFAPGQGEVLGSGGRLRRFRLGVEENLDEDLDALAAFVDQTLGAPQGWTAGGEVSFQRVPDGAGHDFTIYLATSATTDRMCGAGGLVVITPSLPEGGVSCRLGGQVILNLHRWWQSVPHYVDEQVPLEVYRQMVLNHEVGHELGYGHEACPAAGGPAPVMQQQTLSLQGCQANPWPYLDGVRHTGPAVP